MCPTNPPWLSSETVEKRTDGGLETVTSMYRNGGDLAY